MTDKEKAHCAKPIGDAGGSKDGGDLGAEITWQEKAQEKQQEKEKEVGREREREEWRCCQLPAWRTAFLHGQSGVPGTQTHGRKQR
eukprot:s765_g10.t1